MFGLTLDKLVLVAVVAGLVIGPRRLGDATRTLATTIRSLRAFVEASRSRAAEDLGLPLTRAEWEELDLRRFDPRRIVREALDDRPNASARDTEAGGTDAGGTDAVSTDAAVADGTDAPATGSGAAAPVTLDAALYPGLDRVRRGQRYLVLGDAAHPRRIALASLPVDDPRRVRAETVIGPAAVVVPEAAAAADATLGAPAGSVM